MSKSISDGTIRQRPDGRWEARYQAGLASTGKYIRKSVYGDSEKEVKSKLREALALLEKGIDITNRTTFGQWLIQWLKEYKVNEVRETTYKIYLQVVHDHLSPHLGTIPLQAITTMQLQKVLNSFQKDGARLDGQNGGLSPAYITKIRNVLHGALEQAKANNLIVNNPAKGVVIQSVPPSKVEAMTVEEQNTFVEVVRKHPMRVFFLFALASGLRRGELLGLSWDDINFMEKTIYVHRSAKRITGYNEAMSYKTVGEVKTFSSTRYVPLMDWIIPELVALHNAQANKSKDKDWNPHNLVFCTCHGSVIDESTIRRYLDKILREARIPRYTCHALRHTFATRALEARVPAKVVSEWLGHKDVAFTLNTYVHVTPESSQTEISRLNALYSSNI